MFGIQTKSATSTKYTTLLDLARKGIAVPDMLYLDEDSILEEKTRVVLVDNFVQQTAKQHYIVRSALVCEDGHESSYAGMFLTSGPTPAGDVAEMVLEIYNNNKARAAALETHPPVHLLVMPYVNSTCGGVIFYPWLYFYKHALLSYAQTAKEVVEGGAGTKTVLFPLDGTAHDDMQDFLLTSTLREKLQLMLAHVQSHCPYRIDAEWVYDGEQLWLVQVRPVTIAPTSLHTASLEAIAGDMRHEYDQYAEAFGKLSCLSFSLLEFLFAHAHHYHTTMSLGGGSVPFRRLRTGNIVTESDAKRRYFSNQSWYSAFARSFKARSIEKVLWEEAKSFTPSIERFSIQACQFAFDRLQIAELNQMILTRTRSTYALPQEYELSENIDVECYPNDTLTNVWKRHFMRTITPLRAEVRTNPAMAFCTYEEYADRNFSEADTRYEQELPHSVIGVQPHDVGDEVELIIGAHTSGQVVAVRDPDSYRGPFPKGCVVVTHHVPSTWIPYMGNMKGIVCSCFMPLTHVAITARELNLCVVKVPTSMLGTLYTKRHVTTKKLIL